MREIKFRAFDKDRGDMYYIDDLYWFEEEGVRDSSGDGHFANYILMQYTGIKDSKGKEIYEGDIVKVSEEYGGHAYSPLVVDFKDSCFVLRRINYMSDYNPMFKYDFTQVYEIIGNIYDNPELLSD